jgi:L-2-hydroxyglutarate oxidase LhgO
MQSATFDVVIVGSGIVGLSTAQELLQRNPKMNIAILEKEARAGVHASGRNSGVMHCGIFYGADTLKAKVCAAGAARMQQFALSHGIAYNRSGKLVLATDASQLPSVERLLKNASDNGITAVRFTPQQAAEIEPFAAPAAAAIYCPDTAVIDSASVVQKLRLLLEEKGVTFIFAAEVNAINPQQKTVTTTAGTYAYGYLFNCAGAYADRVARMFDLAHDYALVPFKGIYWKLNAETQHKVRANIYPVPDTSLPFLGIHLTRVISGDVYLGPTAIPALGRENYHGLGGINLAETAKIMAMFAGMYGRNKQNFRKLTHMELAKYTKRTFFNTARKLMPSLKMEDMVPTKKAGIRPQLVNRKTGMLEMDYIFESSEHSLHVLNTISPAFTSSFAFAEMIVDRSGIA